MALPTLGPRRLGEVRIGPAERRRLTRRAFAYAKQQNAPIIAADRSALKVARRLRRVDVRSVKGATNIAEGEIRGAIKGLKTSGLKGGYLREASSALANRAADVAGTEPALIATVRSTHLADIQGAKTNILSDRARQAQQAAEIRQSEMTSARTQGREYLTHRRSARAAAAKKGKTHKRNVQLRKQAAGQDLTTAINMLVAAYPGKPIPSTDAEWAGFTSALKTQLGGSNTPARAQRTVRRLQRPRVLAVLLARLGSDQLLGAFQPRKGG